MSRSDVPASGPRHVPSIELPDAALDYRADWVDSDTADAWLQELILATPWTQPEIRLYGRQVAVPRLVAWYGDSQAAYRYSGLQHEPLAWTPLLQGSVSVWSAKRGTASMACCSTCIATAAMPWAGTVTTKSSWAAILSWHR